MSGYVFGRGSNVLEYWLTNAEGFAVRSRGSRLGVVRGVVIDPAHGRATAIVVRSPLLHRRRTVLAREVEAVDPAARLLEVEPAPVAVAPPEPDRGPAIVDVLAGWAGTVDRWTERSVAWLAPRLRRWGSAAVAFVRSQLRDLRAAYAHYRDARLTRRQARE